MFTERLHIQKFIMLSLLAHLILGGLLSKLQISVPFPSERPLRVRIVDQRAPGANRPPLDSRNLGQFSGRAQRPAEKEGPAKTPDSSLHPNLESASPRAAILPPPPPPQVGPAAPAPRAVPSPSMPAVPSAPSLLAESPPSSSPTAAPRTAPTPLIAPPPRVAPAPAAPAGKAAAVPPPMESAGRPREARATRAQGVPPALGSERAANAASPGRPGTPGAKGAQGGPSSGDGVEGPARPYDLRGQVAMLWKNLDPSKYPYQDADTGEEGDTGSTTERTISLDSQDSRFASYLLGVKRRIENTWGYPPEARGLTGNLVVTFGITRDGRLSDLQLIDTSGIAPLDNEAVRAIREAAPFAPFPERMKFERLNIRAAFYYYASRAGLRGR